MDEYDGKTEFERIFRRIRKRVERARLEQARVQRELSDSLEQLRAEVSAARSEFERAIRRGRDPLPAARKYRDAWGAWPNVAPRRRRPPRGLDGGEPLPVEPRPKPTPLMGGAEAPID